MKKETKDKLGEIVTWIILITWLLLGVGGILQGINSNRQTKHIKSLQSQVDMIKEDIYDESAHPFAILKEIKEPIVKIPLKDTEQMVRYRYTYCNSNCSRRLPLSQVLKLIIDEGGYKYIPEETTNSPAKIER